MVLHLYGGGFSRALMPRWYMLEKQIEHRLINLDMRAREHKTDQYLQINPFGKLPALTDDSEGLVIFETGAILQYLSEYWSDEMTTKLIKSQIIQWITFANSTLSGALFVPSLRQKDFDSVIAVLDTIYSTRKYLVGESWTAADCAVCGYLAYIPLFARDADLSAFAAVSRKITEVQDNPRYQKAMTP